MKRYPSVNPLTLLKPVTSSTSEKETCKKQFQYMLKFPPESADPSRDPPEVSFLFGKIWNQVLGTDSVDQAKMELQETEKQLLGGKQDETVAQANYKIARNRSQ